MSKNPIQSAERMTGLNAAVKWRLRYESVLKTRESEDLDRQNSTFVIDLSRCVSLLPVHKRHYIQNHNEVVIVIIEDLHSKSTNTFVLAQTQSDSDSKEFAVEITNTEYFIAMISEKKRKNQRSKSKTSTRCCAKGCPRGSSVSSIVDQGPPKGPKRIVRAPPHCNMGKMMKFQMIRPMMIFLLMAALRSKAPCGSFWTSPIAGWGVCWNINLERLKAGRDHLIYCATAI
ncbi:hypothetical protein DFH28DRAFT_923782 [Melampsora americana]|nr:hypothetical protein DFH28DRAFT_923782 [Melampsora americana]